MTTSAYVLIIGLLVAIVAISVVTMPSSPATTARNDDKEEVNENKEKVGDHPLSVTTKPIQPIDPPANSDTDSSTEPDDTDEPVVDDRQPVVAQPAPRVDQPIAPRRVPSRFPLKHKVVSNDNYTRLAIKYYGCKDNRSKHLCALHIGQANPGITSDALQIGQKITIPTLTPKLAALLGGDALPAVHASAEPVRVERSQGPDLSAYVIYIAKRNDNMTKIARVQLGDANKKNQLFQLNKRLGLMQNINDIKAGQQIVLRYK